VSAWRRCSLAARSSEVRVAAVTRSVTFSVATSTSAICAAQRSSSSERTASTPLSINDLSRVECSARQLSTQ
jgi:hypothetical protein